MPRPRTAQGRPGTEVIPTGWEAAHRPVSEKTMTATAELSVPATGQHWDDTADEMVADTSTSYFTGPCRVQALNQTGQPIVTAEDTEQPAAYLVTLPATVTPTEGHHLTVTNTGDPALDDLLLIVQNVTRGSLRFERDLFCTLA